MHHSYKNIIQSNLLILFIFLSLDLLCQRDPEKHVVRHLNIWGRITDNTNDSMYLNAQIIVFSNSHVIIEDEIGWNGQYTLDLDSGSLYTIVFTKLFYKNKSIIVDLTNPGKHKDGYQININIDLIPGRNNRNLTPVANIKYDKYKDYYIANPGPPQWWIPLPIRN